MAPGKGRNNQKGAGGFTLVEAAIAVAILGMFALICFSTILFSRVASLKARQQGIMTDFVVHYAETLKALPFSGLPYGLAAGSPINPLFNGSGSYSNQVLQLHADILFTNACYFPDIRIPASGSWVSLNTQDYYDFHPDLLWLTNSNPQLQVTLATNWATVLGTPVVHDIHVTIVAAWDSPLGRGARCQQQLDLVRTKDL